MQRVTDIYGPIPYSKVLVSGEGSESDGLNAAYDSQKDVYMRMFQELEEADQALEDNMTEGNSGLKSWMMSTTENCSNGDFFSIHYNYAWLCAYATPIWLPKLKALPRKP